MTADHSGTSPFFSIQTPKKQKTYNFFKKSSKKFGSFKKVRTFAIPNEKYGSYAEIAQLVEHNLAKVGVASSSLVFRSKRVSRNADLNYEITRRGTIICRSSFTKVGFFLYIPPPTFSCDKLSAYPRNTASHAIRRYCNICQEPT